MEKCRAKVKRELKILNYYIKYFPNYDSQSCLKTEENWFEILNICCTMEVFNYKDAYIVCYSIGHNFILLSWMVALL